MIKKSIMLSVFALTFSKAFSQKIASKELLCKTWTFDMEAMKPIIMATIKSNPIVAILSEVKREKILNIAIEQISGSKIEYKIDGTTAKYSKSGNSYGTWALSDDGKKLSTKSKGKPDKIFSFLEISKTKLSIIDTDGKNLVLKLE